MTDGFLHCVYVPGSGGRKVILWMHESAICSVRKQWREFCCEVRREIRSVSQCQCVCVCVRVGLEE